MTLRQRSGFFVLILLIIILELILYLKPIETEKSPQYFTNEEIAIANKFSRKENYNVERKTKTQLFAFNPNQIDDVGLMKLGFSEKQAKSIIKFRYILGGNFKSIKEFGESYVISDKKLKELKPYINLKIINRDRVKENNVYKQNRINVFYLNQLSKSKFIDLGFSERQAQTILNFKNSLKNKRFESSEQFHKCYAVNDYMFQKLKPYIRIKKENSKNKKLNKELFINKMSLNDLLEIGFSRDSAEGVIKYREFINDFNDRSDLRNCKYISNKMYNKIVKKINFKNKIE